jgi:hypothetical protein
MTKEQLKTVAEYDGWTIEPGMEKERNPFYNKPFKQGFTPQMFLLSNLPFGTSWDAQIPVWSKAFSEADDLLDTMQADENFLLNNYNYACDRLNTCIKKYHEALDNNSPTDGFKVLVELIQFINKHKKKT